MNDALPLRRVAGALILALALPAAAEAQVDPGPAGSGRETVVIKDRAAGQVVRYVYSGKFSFVRIERAEAGAPANELPWAIDPAALSASLAGLRAVSGADSDPVFGEDELKEIVPPLARALAAASGSQEVSFAVAGKHGYGGLLATRDVTTARVFRRDGRLQLIFGLLHENFEDQFLQTGVLRPFDPGTRSAAILRASQSVTAPHGSSLRRDWVALDAAAGVAPAASAPAAAAPASVAAPAPATAAPATAAPATAAPAMIQDPDAAATQLANRLKVLNRLHDQGLVTDQEYQQKRAQLLHDL